VNDEQIDALIHELEAFIDDPCVCLKCVVELQNFSMEAESISLANALSIRRLSDDEVSELHGGPYWSAARPSVSLHEISGFAVVAQITEPKRFGDSSMVQSSEFAKLTTSLDQVLLALRTFKSGQTGLSVIQIIPPDFLGFRSSLSRIGDLPVPPFGAGFQLSASEVEHFREHAARLFSPLDPAIELACSRLSDAEARNRYQDRLLDAVIGLEAVLLVSVGTDDRRGELTNRFALNFSTLHDGAKERFRQYLIARDMFGHRSTIAHGGDIKGDNLKLGDEKVTLIDAANRACGMLRFVIRRFLPEGASPTFRRERWWERKLFGLESEAR